MIDRLSCEWDRDCLETSACMMGTLPTARPTCPSHVLPCSAIEMEYSTTEQDKASKLFLHELNWMQQGQPATTNHINLFFTPWKKEHFHAVSEVAFFLFFWNSGDIAEACVTQNLLHFACCRWQSLTELSLNSSMILWSLNSVEDMVDEFRLPCEQALHASAYITR